MNIEWYDTDVREAIKRFLLSLIVSTLDKTKSKSNRCEEKEKKMATTTTTMRTTKLYNKGLPRTTTQKDNHHYSTNTIYIQCDSITVTLISMHTHQLVAFRIILRIYLLRMMIFQANIHTHWQLYARYSLFIRISNEFLYSLHLLHSRSTFHSSTITISFHTKI